MKKSIVLLIVMMLVGCVPVSHIIVGEARDPLSPSQVKIYSDFPEDYKKIALIDAGSNFAFKDPAILFTWQSKMNKVIERLKIEAAKLGANGVVMVGTDNKIYRTFNLDKDGNASSSSYTEKFGKAIAIYVIEKK